ncbi:MAG TPA: hypothetical protein VHM66_08770 [Solirubrobacterales bacterium]|nr:hypothetical protein [Solirubrobacterales bacterium]
MIGYFGQTIRRLGRQLSGLALPALLGVVLLCPAGAAAAEPPPSSTRLVYAAGKIVPIPASIPHEAGDMVDRRIVPDLRWISQRYPIYVTDGYSGPLPNGEHVGCNNCHVKGSDHYNGLAVDIVPLEPTSVCDSHWAAITRLALWAEPRQDMPIPPFRWVGYNGDVGHGCGNHLHLSWNHSPAPQFQLAEWVEVFPVGAAEGEGQPRGKPAPTQKKQAGPSGGISQVTTGGLSPRSPGD